VKVAALSCLAHSNFYLYLRLKKHLGGQKLEEVVVTREMKLLLDARAGG
jgi:hypothetical protein